LFGTLQKDTLPNKHFKILGFLKEFQNRLKKYTLFSQVERRVKIQSIKKVVKRVIAFPKNKSQKIDKKKFLQSPKKHSLSLK
jgi:hypothetical protein